MFAVFVFELIRVVLELGIVFHVADLLCVVVLEEALLVQGQVVLVVGHVPLLDVARLVVMILTEVTLAEASSEGQVVAHSHDVLIEGEVKGKRTTYFYLMELIAAFADIIGRI